MLFGSLLRALLRSFERVFGVALSPADERDALLGQLRSACPPGVFADAEGEDNTAGGGGGGPAKNEGAAAGGTVAAAAAAVHRLR